jgi:hypothetical protein
MRMIIVIMYLFASTAIIALAQSRPPTWISGKGAAIGTDFFQMRTQALNNARSYALYKAGVFVKSSGISLMSESSTGSVDFYSKFAESSSRGLILEEKILSESNPVRIKSGATGEFQMEIEIQALVAVQEGVPDEGFEVTLEPDREAYQEQEAVRLRITSSRDGYLTLFNIFNDSLVVLFPNAMEKDNFVFAGKEKTFPSNANYQLELEVPSGKEESVESFLVIVTKDKNPFMGLDKVEYAGDRLKIRQAMLSAYASWIYKIPIDRRCSTEKVVRIFKKGKYLSK